MRTLRFARRALLITALIPTVGCEDLLHQPEIDPDAVPRHEVLALSRTGGDLPLRADGATQDTILAHIPPGSTPRVVTFTTSRGHFALRPQGGELKVRAEPSQQAHDPRLVARAVLVADTLPGRAVVSASIGDFTAHLVVPFVD